MRVPADNGILFQTAHKSGNQEMQRKNQLNIGGKKQAFSSFVQTLIYGLNRVDQTKDFYMLNEEMSAEPQSH